jgi:hypothetical protein
MATWFITGTSSGFGRHLTELLLERGDRVAATCREIEAMDDLEGRYGHRLWKAALDVTDTSSPSGCAVVSYRCFEITPRCEPVAPGAKQKINVVAVRVQGAIQILPLPLDLDIGLVHTPTLAHRAFVAAKYFLEHRQQLHGPAMYRRMIHFDPTLGHHFFQMTQAQRISNIPAHAGQDHIQRIVQPFQHPATVGFNGFLKLLLLRLLSASSYLTPLLRQNQK